MGSAAVNDVTLGVDSKLGLHTADTADLRRMPCFAECLAMTFGSGLYLQFLEAVLTTVITRMPSCNSFGPLEGDWLFQRPYRESFGGVSASGRGFRRVGVSTCVCSVGLAARETNSLSPPIAPMTPAASAGRKIVEFFPCARVGKASRYFIPSRYIAACPSGNADAIF